MAAQALQFLTLLRDPWLGSIVGLSIIAPPTALWLSKEAPLPSISRLIGDTLATDGPSGLEEFGIVPSPNLPRPYIWGHPDTICFSPPKYKESTSVIETIERIYDYPTAVPDIGGIRSSPDWSQIISCVCIIIVIIFCLTWYWWTVFKNCRPKPVDSADTYQPVLHISGPVPSGDYDERTQESQSMPRGYVKNFQEDIQQLQGQVRGIPQLQQDLTNSQWKNREISDAIERKGQEIVRLRKNNEKLTENLGVKDSELQALQEANDDKEEMTLELERLQKTARDLKAANNRKDQDIQQLKAQIAKLQSVQTDIVLDLQDAERDLKEMTGSRNRCQDAFHKQEQMMQTLQRDNNILQRKIKFLENQSTLEQSRHQTQLEKLQNQIDQLKQTHHQPEAQLRLQPGLVHTISKPRQLVKGQPLTPEAGAERGSFDSAVVKNKQPEDKASRKEDSDKRNTGTKLFNFGAPIDYDPMNPNRRSIFASIIENSPKLREHLNYGTNDGLELMGVDGIPHTDDDDTLWEDVGQSVQGSDLDDVSAGKDKGEGEEAPLDKQATVNTDDPKKKKTRRHHRAGKKFQAAKAAKLKVQKEAEVEAETKSKQNGETKEAKEN